MKTRSTATRQTTRSAVALVTGAFAVGLLAPSTAAADNVAGYAPDVQRAAVATITASQGITEAAAKQILRTQAESVRTLDRLGVPGTASYLDTSGKPVVNVLTTADAQRVTTAGATARFVTRSVEQLDAARAALAAVPSVTHTAIGTDPKANQVVLTVADAATGPGLRRLLGVADSLGDAVRVDRVAGQLREAILGGEAITGGGTRCSAGFNGNRGGVNYNVTAGHCTRAVSQWNIGPSEDASFPGNDYGLIRVTNSTAPGAVTKYDGTRQEISQAGNATVGQRICKSGSTTRLTCGSVQRTGVTVNYPQGSVDDLIQTSASVNPGDSGGCLFDGSTALGITSGMGGGSSFFQPVPEALSAYGVQLN